jgi:hypothetical protein
MFYILICVLGEFSDISTEAIVLAETDEMVKTTIKLSTLFFILFVNVDT